MELRNTELLERKEDKEEKENKKRQDEQKTKATDYNLTGYVNNYITCKCSKHSN